MHNFANHHTKQIDMTHIGMHQPNPSLGKIGLKDLGTVYWNLPPAELVEHALKAGQGLLADNGALAVDTDEFTGRSPKDRFIVKDEYTADTVDWGNINIPFEAEKFDRLLIKMQHYLEGQDVYVRDAFACADPKYRISVRVVTEKPWQSMFVNNMFIRPTKDQLTGDFEPDWTVLAVPSFKANAEEDGTRQHNFAIINFTRKMIIIGGTAYTGEIKKGIFSVLNFLLPHEKNVLSMHCSANKGKNGDTAIFFGLSGTGKTTLSADPDRHLIGDDEHGWADDSVFNFEGGCYAKVINLSEEGEPDIFRAIKFGALLENIRFKPGTRSVAYEDKSVTENTRVSYPLNHIQNAVEPSVSEIPSNIFFLTCDAFGVLPPISRLTPAQAMFHFISGYTAKVAGTEAGVTEPQVVFSACFGAPFMPLHPTKYAEMLGEKMRKQEVNVWLVNTGWSGGPYGVGSRMKLAYTRAMITAALEGKLDNVAYHEDPIFGLPIPEKCEGVPEDILNPLNTWSDKEAYHSKANELANRFNQNFAKFGDKAATEVKEAAPQPVSMKYV